LWAGGIGVGAYLAGPAVIEVVNDFGTVSVVLLAGLVGAAAALEVVRRRRRRPWPPRG
jgi:hypothetical protein